MKNLKQNIKIVRSASNNPWFNLGIEEYLLSHVNKNEVILYLWQNQNTIVIGRNQNAWKECKCDEFEKDGGRLARRLSGGGAVFHDLGNLNFTFVMDKNLYDLKKQLKVILIACKKLGINAEFTGRNDITVNGRKFSGNAFYFGKNSSYHHGTILVDVDFSKLSKYLQVSKEKIKSKGIDSVQSRVVNLKSINKDLTIEKMIEELKETFIELYGENIDKDNVCEEIIDDKDIVDRQADDKQNSMRENSNEEVNGKDNVCEEIIDDKQNNYKSNINKQDLDKLYKKYSSWEWRYGKTPKFDISFDRRFEWGDTDIKLSLDKGTIKSAKIFSDAMNADLIENISKKLNGLEFKKDVMIEAIKNMSISSTSNMKSNKDQIIIQDICSLFNDISD